MGRPSFRHTIGFSLIVGLASAGLAVPGDAGVRFATASSGRIEDSTGDGLGRRPVPVHEPRADLTTARAVRSGDRIDVSATVVQPTDPATDGGWVEPAVSFLAWGLDTNSDGKSDFTVWMSSKPTLHAAVFKSDTGTAPAGCVPVAAYSPAGYTVSIAAACVGSPATFRWNVYLYYDMSHRDDGAGAQDTLLGEDEMILVPGTADDPTDDVISVREANNPRGDLIAATIAYEPGRIAVTATTDEPFDPSLDPNWAEGGEIGWYFDTDGDDDPDFIAAIGSGGLAVTVYDVTTGNYEIACTSTASYSPAAYSTTIDPACIGSPARLWWGVTVMYEQGEQASLDIAPDQGMAGPISAPGATGKGSGYWMMTSDGDVFAFGDARPLTGDIGPGDAGVDIEPTPTGNGFWMLTSLGRVTGAGDAHDFGDAAVRRDPSGQLRAGERAAALSATPNGDGYWIFTDQGRVLPYGAAAHHGDMAGTRLNGPVLDSVATPSGEGYWMVGSDGGIFAFGDATFSGSTGDLELNQPVMSMAADPDGRGYWLVASDGGIFAFDASFHGSMGATPLNKPISGMVPGPGGYLMVAEDGGIFAFGKVAFHGSLGADPPARPVVAVALAPRSP